MAIIWFVDLLGLLALAFAMERHWRDVLGGKITRRQQVVLRYSGSVLIAASASAAVWLAGWSIGLTWWTGLSAVAGLLVVLLLSYAPPRRRG